MTRRLGIALTVLSVALLLGGPRHATGQELLLFGGSYLDVFLGCINCGSLDRGSIWNPVGNYGNSLCGSSIGSKFGRCGSPFSALSPWNSFASYPPVEGDREGNFYGYFTTNDLHPRRTQLEALVHITDNWEWVIDHLKELQRQR